MKLFQQLLVAPAALGLFAPIAANAAEVNINDVASYSNPSEQVATSQFSDVVPGDWAYTALQNLSASYGCVDNAYTQSLNNGQALTRYEAAALVNACLDGGLIAGGEGLTSDAVRLTDEFGSEMAILKGRIDGLEYKVNELSAGAFSSTTSLKGSVNFNVGALSNNVVTTDDNLHGNYEAKYTLSSSFTGQDNLVTKFEMGNSEKVLNIDPESSVGDSLTLTDVYYSFPATDSIQVSFGPKMDRDQGLAGTSTIYGEKSYLESLPFSLNDENGVGVTVAYVGAGGFNAGINYTGLQGKDATRGIFSDEDGDNLITAQIGYDGDTFGGTFNYLEPDSTYSAYGFGLYFTPENFPSISASYDIKNNDDVDNENHFLIGSEFDLGPGTLGLGIGTVNSTVDAEATGYEAYYVYNVADGVNVTPTVFVLPEQGEDGDSATGIAVTLGFKF